MRLAQTSIKTVLGEQAEINLKENEYYRTAVYDVRD